MATTPVISTDTVVNSGTEAVTTTVPPITASVGSMFSSPMVDISDSVPSSSSDSARIVGTTPFTFSDSASRPSTSTSTAHNIVGILPTNRGLERTSIMFNTYWDLKRDTEQYLATRACLLRKRKRLDDGINYIKRFYAVADLRNSSIALAEPYTELEAVNRQLNIVESDHNKKMALFKKLPSVMASEDVLAVKSLKDIEVVHDLQKSLHWNGRVKLVRGGPDTIEECLGLMEKYKIRRTND